MDESVKKYWTGPLQPPRLSSTPREAQGDAAGQTLRITVTSEARLSEALRERVERRVLLALSRFGPRVLRITVRLAEPVNALGGIDQRCRMRAWLTEGEGIQAEALNGGIEAVVTRAAAQIAKRVDSALIGGRTRSR